MYLNKAVFINNGPLAELEITPEFNSDGSPKPLLLVGQNGSGKTNVLSLIADALQEVAAKSYSDILPALGIGHSFYRLLGGSTKRTGAIFELTAIKFVHRAHQFSFVSKSGTLSPSSPHPKMASFAGLNTGPEVGSLKTVTGPENEIEAIFREGAYVFFPTDRHEIPHWLNTKGNTGEAEIAFNVRLKTSLGKPIVVTTSISDTKRWIADLLLDSSVHSAAVISSTDLDTLKRAAHSNLQHALPLFGLVTVIRQILQNPEAKLSRLGRQGGERKLQIVGADEQPIVPTLNGLSSGQSTLLSIFSTILRYGDGINQLSDTIDGVVLIDEADAHLHADLQHDVLPKLIQLFPRVQFIVSSHAPLFPLGMTKVFGEDGFTLIDLPTGSRIDAERFGEFERSFAFYQETKAFEKKIGDAASSASKPLVICEGETDPIYLKAAAELLGFKRLAEGVIFDWVGQKTGVGAEDGGKGSLDSARKFLKNNSAVISAPIALVYDADANRSPESSEKLFICSLLKNSEIRSVGAELRISFLKTSSKKGFTSGSKKSQRTK